MRIESALVPGDPSPVTLAIGPDGGWIDREIASFSELGFAPVSIGSAVLRVEAAVAALLSEVALLRRLPSAQ
jgi:RsmE family RNA methyltransferase